MAGAVALFQAWHHAGALLDDAFISLRYARNLVEGHGLVFNPGEYVEGFTNLLWVLAAAASLKLGLDPVVALKALSAIAAVVTLVVVYHAGSRDERPHVFPVALVLLLLLEDWAYWATTTLETMAFTAVAVAALYRAWIEDRDGRRAGALPLFLLLALIRPDGALWFGLYLIAACVDLHRRDGRWFPRRRVPDAIAMAATTLGLTAWRWSYYGDVVPNTFHARITGGPEQWIDGANYVADWAMFHPVLAAALLLPVVTLAAPRLRRALIGGHELRLLWPVALGWTLYVIAVGGDWMPFHRFFLPVTPLLALIAAGVLDAMLRDLRRGERAIVIAAVLILHVGPGLVSDQRLRAFFADRDTRAGLRVGQHLATVLDPDAWIAVNTAGAVPWASRLRTIDMLGLNDPEIARHPVYVISPNWRGHRRGWGDYVFSRRPEVVLWCNATGSREPQYLGDRQLADNPFFRFFYQLVREELPTASAGSDAIAVLPWSSFADHVGTEPKLGIRVEPHRFPVPYTRVFETPFVVLQYWKRRHDRDELWSAYEASHGDVERFLEAVTDVWRGRLERPREADRLRAEALCRDALARIAAGEPGAARAMLELALVPGGGNASPLPYQYIANLAVAEGNLPLAVQAQSEALRLAPDDPLYRRNLLDLLRVSWKNWENRRDTVDPTEISP